MNKPSKKNYTPAKEVGDKAPTLEELNLAWELCQKRGVKVEVAATPSAEASSARSQSVKRAASSASEPPPPSKSLKTVKSLPITVPAGPTPSVPGRHSALTIQQQSMHYLDVVSLLTGWGYWLAKESSCPQILCGYLVLSNAPASLAGNYVSVGPATLAFGSSLQHFLPLGAQLINWASLGDASPSHSVAKDQIPDDEPFVHLCVPLQTPIVSAVPEAPKRDAPHICPIALLVPAPSQDGPPSPPSPHIAYYVSGVFAHKLQRAKCIGVVRFYVWNAAEVALACQYIQSAMQERVNQRMLPGTFTILVLPSYMKHELSLPPLSNLEVVFHIYLDGADKPIPRELVEFLRAAPPGDNLLTTPGAIFEGASPFVFYSAVHQFRNAPYDARLYPSASSSSTSVASRGLLNYGCLLLFSAGIFRSATLAQFLTFLASLLPADSMATMLGQEVDWRVHRAIKFEGSGKADSTMHGFLVYADGVLPDYLLTKAREAVPELKVQTLGVSPLEPFRQVLMEHVNGIASKMFPSSTVGGGFEPGTGARVAGVPPASCFPGLPAVTAEVGVLRTSLNLVENQLEDISDRVDQGGRLGNYLQESVGDLQAALQCLRNEFEASQSRLTVIEHNQGSLAKALERLNPMLVSLLQAPSTPAAFGGDGLSAGALLTLPSEVIESLQAIGLTAPSTSAMTPSSAVAVGRDLTAAAEMGSLGIEPLELLSSWPQNLPSSFVPSPILDDELLEDVTVQDDSLLLQCSAGPDLPSSDVSPLQWRLVGLDSSGVGISLHFPATLATVQRLGDPIAFGAGVRACAQIAVYLYCVEAIPLDAAPPGSIVWEPTYYPGWFRSPLGLTSTLLTMGLHVGVLDGKFVTLATPESCKIKAIVQQILRQHRAALPDVLSRLIHYNKIVTAEVGAYSLKLQLTAAAFAAALSPDPTAADMIWDACRGSVCTLYVSFPEEGANRYHRFNILHAVGEVLYGRKYSDNSSPPSFLKDDSTSTKLSKSLREAFTSLFEADIPADKREDWNAFTKFLNDKTVTPPPALTDAVLQDQLEAWKFGVPYLLRKAGAQVARLYSLGDGAATVAGILALDSQKALCINQSASSTGPKRAASTVTASIISLSPPMELQAALITAVFSSVPEDFPVLPPQFRCLATMGNPYSESLIHE